MDKLPLNVNGKVDKKSLINLEDMGLQTKTEYIAPRTDIERALVEIWEEILNRKDIGIKDNFFELGGHSLMTTRVISKIHEKFNVKIRMNMFFQEPMIETLSMYIETLSSKEQKNVENSEELIL